MKIVKIESPTGADLAVYLFKGPKEPKGIVHINHGLAEHAARYERFAHELAKAGYQAIGHDHRGHGKTTTHEGLPLGQFSTSDGWEHLITDIFVVNAFIKENFAGLPITYFGHSMGGIVGVSYLIRHSDSVQSAALWNMSVDGGFLLSTLRGLLKAERMFKGSDVPSTLANSLTFTTWNKKFKPNRTEFDWLSRDEKEVDKYVADPLCGFPASNSLWLDLTDGLKLGSNDAELAKIRKDLPIHLLAGQKDPCTEEGKSITNLAERLTKSKIQDLTVKLLRNTRHETLNEINRDEAMAEFIQWLNSKTG